MNKYISTAKNFLKSCNAKMSITFKRYGKHFEDDKDYRNIYTVKIDRNGKSFSFQFGDSVMNTQNGNRPTCYDVLACLQKYDVGSFENFCDEYGYTIDCYEDKKRITKIYRAVAKEFDKVTRIFGDVMDELQEIY